MQGFKNKLNQWAFILVWLDPAYVYSAQERNLQGLTGHVVGALLGILGLDD